MLAPSPDLCAYPPRWWWRLIYLPVMGGVTDGLERWMKRRHMTAISQAALLSCICCCPIPRRCLPDRLPVALIAAVFAVILWAVCEEWRLDKFRGIASFQSLPWSSFGSPCFAALMAGCGLLACFWAEPAFSRCSPAWGRGREVGHVAAVFASGPM